MIKPHGLSVLKQVNGAYVMSYAFNWSSTAADGDIAANEGLHFDSLSSINGSYAFTYAFTEVNFRNVYFPNLQTVS